MRDVARALHQRLAERKRNRVAEDRAVERALPRRFFRGGVERAMVVQRRLDQMQAIAAPHRIGRPLRIHGMPRLAARGERLLADIRRDVERRGICHAHPFEFLGRKMAAQISAERRDRPLAERRLVGVAKIVVAEIIGVNPVGPQLGNDAFDLAADIVAQLWIGEINIHEPDGLPAAFPTHLGAPGLPGAQLREAATRGKVIGDFRVAAEVELPRAIESAARQRRVEIFGWLAVGLRERGQAVALRGGMRRPRHIAHERREPEPARRQRRLAVPPRQRPTAVRHAPIGGEERGIVADLAEIVIDDALDARLLELGARRGVDAILFDLVEIPEAVPAVDACAARRARLDRRQIGRAQPHARERRERVPPRRGGVIQGLETGTSAFSNHWKKRRQRQQTKGKIRSASHVGHHSWRIALTCCASSSCICATRAACCGCSARLVSSFGSLA